MYLDELFSNAPHIEIKQLSCDSRIEMQDAIFFCVDGSVYNGHNFYKEAIKNGAVVIVHDNDIDTSLNAIFIKVNDTLEALIKTSIKFYDDPCSKLYTYVISGCYGKSITSTILNRILQKHEKTGYISERGLFDGRDIKQVAFRTLNIPDCLEISKQMLLQGVKSAIYESSVLNLFYRKVDPVHANCFIYTTTGEESSEYKELNKAYEPALFDYLSRIPQDSKLIINRDDISFKSLSENTKNSYISYGQNDDSDYRITSIKLFSDKSTFNLIHNGIKYSVETKLLGITNVYNLVACLCALSLRYDMKDLIEDVKDIRTIDGCFYPVEEGQNFQVIIDGASNFETIQNVYQYAKLVTSENNRIITVLPINYLDNATKLDHLMSLSDDSVDLLIITLGDTYGKDVTPLLNNAYESVHKTKCIKIEDREVAIDLAIQAANSFDTVLLLGKGEENYIYKALGKVYYPTDKKIAIESIRKSFK